MLAVIQRMGRRAPGLAARAGMALDALLARRGPHETHVEVLGLAVRAARSGHDPSTRARLLYLRAFFPRHREPYELALERSSQKYDLALLRAPIRGGGVPVLPLEQASERTAPGQPVIVVGYPTGLEAILAKAESGVVRRILESHGTDSERVTLALSHQGLIRPSTTQGHIGDITRTDIVFDAPSAQGGSGGPVFNQNSLVYRSISLSVPGSIPVA